MKRAVVLFVVVVVLAAGGGGCGFGPSSSPAPPSAPSVTPSPLRAPGWEAVTLHTLCLEVQQSYPNAQDKKPEPIAEAAQELLAGLGVRVIAAGEPCDATLALNVVSRATGADYNRAGYISAGYCYTGSEVEGQAVLTVPGHTSLTVPLSGRQDTPRSIERCPKEPAGAPFKVAWMEALLGALYDLWGPPLLIHALADESVLVRHIAADALIQAGPEAAEAVPALIQALQDADGDVRASAARALREIGPQAIDAVPALIQVLEDAHAGASALAALKAITGQDLAWQTAAWQEWWDTRPADAAAPAPTAPPTPACTRNAVFQADITIPDNTPVQAGQPFVKTWRVRNAGTCDWYAGYRLKFVDGDRMGGPDWVTVPETPAGESAEISAELVAPSEPGRYRGDWQMCLGETDCFGDRIYVQIVSTQ